MEVTGTTENLWPTLIGRQVAAALQMCEQAIEACPDELWDDRSRGTPFWHLTYHALYYTDLYLSDDEPSFAPAGFHVETSNFLAGDYGAYGGIVGTPAQPYTRDQLAGYARRILAKSEETFARLTDVRALERCGFWWYELNAGELALVNLRHLQHHVGQLALLLRRHADVGLDWLGTRDNQPAPPTW